MKVLKISVVYKTQIWQDHQSVYRNTNEIISGTIIEYTQHLQTTLLKGELGDIFSLFISLFNHRTTSVFYFSLSLYLLKSTTIYQLQTMSQSSI